MNPALYPCSEEKYLKYLPVLTGLLGKLATSLWGLFLSI